MSIKGQMTKMIIDFENRDKSEGFTKEEYDDFSTLVGETISEEQQAYEIKNNGFSMYYRWKVENCNDMLVKGFELKNPFCAYNLACEFAYDYVININNNLDIDKLKQYCNIAECVGDGYIYYHLLEIVYNGFPSS